MRHIVRFVKRVGELQLCGIGQFGGNDFLRRQLPCKQAVAYLGEFQVGLAEDHHVGKRADFLFLRLVADLRAAEHNRNRGGDAFEHPHHFQGLPRIPNIHPQADNRGSLRQQLLDDVQRPLVDVELRDARPGSEATHIRRQVAQAERGVNILGVEGAKEDRRHSQTFNQNAPGDKAEIALFPEHLLEW